MIELATLNGTDATRGLNTNLKTINIQIAE